MKVKNIAFSGFMAAIMLSATGAANAATAIEIASKGYVDQQRDAAVSTAAAAVDTKLENYTPTTALPGVIKQNITNVLTDTTTEGGLGKTVNDLKTSVDELDASVNDATNGLTTKASTASVNALTERVSTNETNIAKKADKLTGVTAEQAGSIATVDQNGQYQLGSVKATDLVTNATVTEKITEALEGNQTVKDAITQIVGDGQVVTDAINASVTNGTLKTELDKKANKITGVTADQVGTIATVGADGQYVLGDKKAADLATSSDVTTAITNAVTNNEALKGALDAKADADNVYSKTEADAKFDTKIPVPSEACQATSGRCVLSVATGSDGKTGLVWLDVTSPLEGGTTPTTTAE